jgi:hypothetical protein
MVAHLPGRCVLAGDDYVTHHRKHGKKCNDAFCFDPQGGARQVVMLGAGMDTRPWRLALPPDTHWFELDQADVLGAKVATMRAAGAQLEDAPTAHHAGTPSLFPVSSE